MQSIATCTQRHGMGGDYLGAVFGPARQDWPRGYRLYKRGQLSAPLALALAHPSYYSEHVSQELICGARAFSPRVFRKEELCASSLLWGYSCTCAVDRHADHLFPYSCGGPTDARNLVILCSVHNRMKNDDIHVFPWERPAPSWLDELLDRINRHLYPGANP